MKRLAILAFGVALLGCASEQPTARYQTITGAQFQSEVAGKQLVYYDKNGDVFGNEYYSNATNSATVWRYANGECLNGRTYVVGTNICFSYETIEQDICHTVSKDSNGFYSLSDGIQTAQIISSQPLRCD